MYIHIYIYEHMHIYTGNHRIRKISNSTGVVTTVAGNGYTGINIYIYIYIFI
jgi:hypothetical protein